jgi:hypothetical protein
LRHNFRVCKFMNFINDIITDEDRKRFDFSVFKRAPDFVYPLSTPTRWTVDRDAGVFLIRIGDQGPDASDEDRKKGVEYYSLWWSGMNIECKLWYFTHAPHSITWKQDWIGVPDEYFDRKEEVIEVLKQALRVYQYFMFSRKSGDPKYPPLSEIKFDF